MDFNHTEERRALADLIDRFIADNYPIEKRLDYAASDTGFSREVWAQLTELGLVGALFDEEDGGFGGGGFDIAVVFEGIGKGLMVEPFLASMMAGRALATGNAAQRAIVEDIVSGETLAAFAHSEPASRYALSHVETAAEKQDDGWVLNGNKAVVISGDSADLIVVSARTAGTSEDENGISLFLVPADAKGVARRGSPTIDGYRTAEIALDNVALPQDALIGSEGEAFATIEAVNAAATLAVCAEALGAVEIAIDLTLEYLKTRKQFGVPIGSFQALQHRMADMMGDREQLRSAVINAAGNLDDVDGNADGLNSRDWNISAAKNLTGRAGRKIAEESIQMHGGMGMTWEYPVGHYAKRIVMIDHLFGDVDYHLERIMGG